MSLSKNSLSKLLQVWISYFSSSVRTKKVLVWKIFFNIKIQDKYWIKPFVPGAVFRQETDDKKLEINPSTSEVL
jgi:hypothetical protein